MIVRDYGTELTSNAILTFGAAHRIEIEIPWQAIEALGCRLQQEIRAKHVQNVGDCTKRGRGWLRRLSLLAQVG